MSDSSDDKMPIKYVLIGDSTTLKIITEFSTGNPTQKTKKEINRIFNKLAKLPNKKYDERNKITAKDENYYFMNVKPDLLFIVLANSQYPERYVFELISKIVEENIPTMVNDETRELNPSGRQALKELVNKYQDIKNINKIAEIQEDVNAIKIDDNFILMKEQLSEFKLGDKIKINFKECHIAICPNGGLIGICKKKGYLDITKGSKINKNIIIMNQNGQRKIYIPIEWNYKYKWIVDFEFNYKEQLYAICNEGSIYKINILNIKAEPKISSELFKNEEIEKCKLYKNGFIALTVEGKRKKKR